MSVTRLTKPVWRRVMIPNHGLYNVALDHGGVTFRRYRSSKEVLLPFGTALTRAAWLAGEKEKPKRARRIRRGASLKKGS